jgi:hypothetical protein
MNPQLKQSWIAALRSGRYAQGRGLLRERTLGGNTYFCAMGVLFDLVATASQWDRLTRPVTRPRILDEVHGYIPLETMGEIGLSDLQQALIAGLNDAGYTFAQIADVIERDFDDVERLRQTVMKLQGARFLVGPPVCLPKPLPDWNAMAGINASMKVAMQPMLHPAWT